jgi:hypothetical protein
MQRRLQTATNFTPTWWKSQKRFFYVTAKEAK